MAQLRKFQFLRNSTPSSFASYADARTAAIAAFAGITTLQDGEIALYSYTLGEDTTVHTLLGIKRTNGIEILGNYDELTAEYQSYVASEIAKLDSEVTGSNNDVSVTVKQVNGKIDSVSVVAPSLTDAIAALDVDPFYLTELNGNTLQRYQISEVAGKIVKGQTADTVLTFASTPNADNKVVTQAEINALDATVTSNDGVNFQVKVVETDGVITAVNVVEDKTVNTTDVAKAINALNANESGTNAKQDITVGVVETAGKITEVTVTDNLADVAHTGAAADVTIADEGNLYTATNVEAALAEVMAKANKLDAAQLEAGTGIEIGTDNKINAKFDIAIETREASEGVTAGTYIVIKDGTNVIAEENANAFVKDGFLQKVELIEATAEGQENVLRFTWNSDAGIQVTEIKVSELCDVYTAKANDWVVLNGFEFSHKTVENVMGTYANNADNITVNSTEEKTFIIPTITVDGAGHVTAVTDKTVKIALPKSIDTAIQDGAGVNTTYIQTTVARNATNTNQLDVKATAVIGDYAAEGQVEGLATTTATKNYVDSKIRALDDSMTTVTEGAGISVSDAAVEGSNDHAYTVALAAAPATVTPDTDDYVAANRTHTRISDITVDEYGRVTAVTKTTVTENFDMGTY